MDPVAPLGCLYLSIQIESMFIYGGDSWIRANDLLRMKELHYRCAMSPYRNTPLLLRHSTGRSNPLPMYFYMVPHDRIELPSQDYKTSVLPLY